MRCAHHFIKEHELMMGVFGLSMCFESSCGVGKLLQLSAAHPTLHKTPSLAHRCSWPCCSPCLLACIGYITSSPLPCMKVSNYACSRSFSRSHACAKYACMQSHVSTIMHTSDRHVSMPSDLKTCVCFNTQVGTLAMRSRPSSPPLRAFYCCCGGDPSTQTRAKH